MDSSDIADILLEDDFNLPPISPSDFLRPLPTTLIFFLEPIPDSTTTISEEITTRPPIAIPATPINIPSTPDQSVPVETSVVNPPQQQLHKTRGKDLRPLLSRTNPIEKQKRREYFTKKARHIKKPRFNYRLDYQLQPDFSNWRLVFWDNRRQEFTIENPTLRGQRITVPLRAISALQQ